MNWASGFFNRIQELCGEFPNATKGEYALKVRWSVFKSLGVTRRFRGANMQAFAPIRVV